MGSGIDLPNLLSGVPRHHGTVACVRDVYYETSNPTMVYANPFKQMVEWVEFHHLHGIGHFFAYTFEGAAAATSDVLNPYFESGVVSWIHWRFYDSNTYSRFFAAVNDCLYRAKSMNAKWLLPTIDFDEYFRPSDSFLPGPFMSRSRAVSLVACAVRNKGIFQIYNIYTFQVSETDSHATLHVPICPLQND